MSYNVTLQDLKQYEKLRLWRLRTGLNQEQAGERFGVSGWTYGEMERGELPVPTYAWRGPFAVQPNEYCLLSRLRAGAYQEEVASALGVSANWLGQMERGKVSCDKLVKYWENNSVW